MSTLQQQIAESFLAKLVQSTEVDANMIDQLRILLAEKKKLKPDDLVKIFAPPPDGELK